MKLLKKVFLSLKLRWVVGRRQWSLGGLDPYWVAQTWVAQTSPAVKRNSENKQASVFARAKFESRGPRNGKVRESELFYITSGRGDAVVVQAMVPLNKDSEILRFGTELACERSLDYLSGEVHGWGT